MNFEEYRALDAINWSSLKAMTTSPLHYQQRTREDIGETIALRLGRALHTLILEPEDFEVRHPLFTGAARRGKGWNEFRDAHAGADPLLSSEAERVLGMAGSIKGSALARKHLGGGVSEKTLQWVDETSGLKCKGRCDSVNGHLVELKTCNGRDFAPGRFESHAARLRYHGQLAYYADGLAAQGYEVDKGPAMIVVESDAPFDCAVYIVKPEVMDAGRGLYRKLLGQLRDCIEAEAWPGVCPDEELHLGLPAWAEWETLEAAEPVTIGGVAFGG